MESKAAVLSRFLENADSDPVAEIVILRADGKKEQVSFDSSPEANMLVSLLGGIVTIVGRWYTNGVVILKQRAPEETAPSNVHNLPKPFQDEKIQGDIALVKMNEDASVCVDFTLDDWEAFVNIAPEELEKLEEAEMKKAAENSEKDAFEIPEHEDADEKIEYEDEEDEEIDPHEIFKMQLLTKVCAFYQEEHGREPTKEEVKESMKKILEAMANGTTEQEDEEGLEDKMEETANEKTETQQSTPLKDVEEPSAKRRKTEAK